MNTSRRGYGYYHQPEPRAYSSNHLAEERARCKEVEAGWKAAQHCHPECTDGYCHRAYTNGIILAKS